MRTLESARADFPTLAREVWFNNGQVGLVPRPVAESVAADMAEIFRNGPPHVLRPDVEWPRRRVSHETVARFLGASAETTAVMRGVSEAYQTVLRGIDWRPGDRLIISPDEEASVLLPSLHLRESAGVEVVHLEYRASPDEIVGSLESMLTPNTRLVALSHVTTNMGWMYPIGQLTKTANQAGVPLFADLAHSAGARPYCMSDLGCDFAGILSYKWMYGPYATGLLYVRPDPTVELSLRYAGGRSERSLSLRDETYELRDDAGRYQHGPWAWPLIHGWAKAVEYLDSFGITQIHSRTMEVSRRLRSGLEEIPGVELLSPAPPTTGPFLTFRLEGAHAHEVAATLYRKLNIRIKAASDPADLLRASIPFFILDEEVDLLIDGIRMVAAK